jgi:hypothetical protein
MNILSWYLEKAKVTQALPLRDYLLFFFGKVGGSFALGLLVASLISGVNWVVVGIVVFIVSFLISIPALPKLFDKK